MSITQPTPPAYGNNLSSECRNKKKDTTFGEMIEKEAKKIYGDDFKFQKCIVEKTKDYSCSWQPTGDYYIVTFVLENHPKD